MSPSDFLLITAIALMAGAIMLLIQKPRALTPKDEAAWLDFAIRTKRAELAEARKHHRPSADLQRELSDLIAKKLRSETEVRKGFLGLPKLANRVPKRTPQAPRLQRRRAF